MTPTKLVIDGGCMVAALCHWHLWPWWKCHASHLTISPPFAMSYQDCMALVMYVCIINGGWGSAWGHHYPVRLGHCGHPKIVQNHPQLGACVLA